MIFLQYRTSIRIRESLLDIKSMFGGSQIRLEDIASITIKVDDVDGVPWIGKETLELKDGRRVDISGFDLSPTFIGAVGEKVVVKGGAVDTLLSLASRRRLLMFAGCVLLLVMNVTGACAARLLSR